MDDEKLRQHESQTLTNLQVIERRWHIAKFILITICCFITIFIVIYYSSQTLNSVNRNRQLISCALSALSPINDKHTGQLLNQCVREYE